METTVRIQARHPLDPLTNEELAAAVSLVRAGSRFGEAIRFISITLKEPEKSVVLSHRAGDSIEREAELVLLDPTDGSVYEVVVSLTEGAVRGVHPCPGAQPAMVIDEFINCDRTVKADRSYQEALRKRGVTDLDLVLVDAWPAGYYSTEDGERRLMRALSWVRQHPDDNAYAHPIENVIAVYDPNRDEVVRVEDHGLVPIPWFPGEYRDGAIERPRDDLKPLEIVQPDGPSFQVHGHEVTWQRWRFRVGFTPREGLVLHTLGYEDAGRLRPILYRASLTEMVVPYGDPAPTHWWKNAFDAGEYNIGSLANSLELGCDCLGEIHYFSFAMADSQGRTFTMRNAVCMHEEDYGVLWKHVESDSSRSTVRRSRRLVISSFSTVGNYDYGFFWYLYQDGTIEYEIKLTGIVSTGALPEGERTPYGQLLNPEGLYAPIHQHFFSVRLDLDIDGSANSVYEVDTAAVPLGPANPHGNAFAPRATLLADESSAQRLIDPLRARYWKVINPTVVNRLGDPVAYRLLPKTNVLPFAHPESSVIRRAGFATKHLWVTAYRQSERYAAGEYPNQHAGGDGLPAWTAANRRLAESDVVLWYTLGSHHPVRPEDWPVMPVQYVGFMLQPVGFFDANPALDVPAPPAADGACHMPESGHEE